MPLQKSSLNLLAEFPPSSYQEWRTAAEKLLKGAPFDERLLTKLAEGFTLSPIYMAGAWRESTFLHDAYPGFGSYRRGSYAEGVFQRHQCVAQEFAHPSPREVNAALREEITRGLDRINIVTDLQTRMGDTVLKGNLPARGVALRTLNDFDALLEGVDLRLTPLMINAGVSSLPLLAFLTACLDRKGTSLSDASGSILCDPLGTLALTGSLPASPPHLFEDMKISIEWAEDLHTKMNVIGVDATCYHDGGALAVEELGFALATGAEYLRQLAMQGCGPDRSGSRFLFTFSLGPDFFLELAKLRAARVLWSSIVTAFGGGDEARKMRMHGRSSSFHATRFDPYVNMLRATTEALAGVLGGCESIHVSAFDEGFREPDDFSRRVARNTQIVLKDEAHVDHVIDPAGGSWYVEWLTDALAERAWKVFQEVEAAGGMTLALKKGLPQEMISRSLVRRLDDICSKRKKVVGVNVYANPQETPPESSHNAGMAIRGTATSPPLTAGRPLKITPGNLRKKGSRELVGELANAARAGASLHDLFTALHEPGDELVSAVPVAAHRLVEAYEEARLAESVEASKGGRIHDIP